ncbi:MAG: hypothetical protein ACLPXB_10240 [Thiobacillaceae bacterium]
MNTPEPMLPAATPENAITVQMQFQIEMMKLLARMVLSLEAIAKNVEKIADKQY